MSSRLTTRPGSLTAACTALAASALPGPAAAAGAAHANLVVAARVIDNCAINSATLSFGPYSKTGGEDLGRGTLAVTCTRQASAKVALNQGVHPDSGSTEAVPARRMSGGNALLGYWLYRDANLSLPWGNTDASALVLTGTGSADPIPVYGRIAAGQDVPPGDYADVVVVTVTF